MCIIMMRSLREDSGEGDLNSSRSLVGCGVEKLKRAGRGG